MVENETTQPAEKKETTMNRNTTPATCRANIEFELARARIRIALDLLEKEIDKLADAQKQDPRNWGFTGSAQDLLNRTMDMVASQRFNDYAGDEIATHNALVKEIEAVRNR